MKSLFQKNFYEYDFFEVNSIMPKYINRNRKERRKNPSFFNLKFSGGVQREKEITETDQLSELSDISPEKQPDSPLDTGFLVSDSESILLLETQNATAVIIYNETSGYINYINSLPEMESFQISNKTSVKKKRANFHRIANQVKNSDIVSVPAYKDKSK
jgi:hypothetical protein